jgi:hypothetical protein
LNLVYSYVSVTFQREPTYNKGDWILQSEKRSQDRELSMTWLLMVGATGSVEAVGHIKVAMEDRKLCTWPSTIPVRLNRSATRFDADTIDYVSKAGAALNTYTWFGNAEIYPNIASRFGG